MGPDHGYGKPCISGIRISVTQVFGSCATIRSFREIMADCFPEDEIRACLEFARELVQNEDIHVVEEV